jgi:AbrB family looped-hinge helix DNA binding protein
MGFMYVSIDKTGRLILPKKIRDQLGLSAGSKLKISEKNNRIILSLMQRTIKLIRKKGVLVVVSEKEGDSKGVKNSIQKTRFERNKIFW